MDLGGTEAATWPGCVNKQCKPHDRVSEQSHRHRLGVSLPRRCREEEIAVAVAIDAHRLRKRLNHTASEEQRLRQYREQVCNEQMSRSGRSVTICCTTSLGRWLPSTFQQPGSASNSCLTLNSAITAPSILETNRLTATRNFHPHGPKPNLKRSKFHRQLTVTASLHESSLSHSVTPLRISPGASISSLRNQLL